MLRPQRFARNVLVELVPVPFTGDGKKSSWFNPFLLYGSNRLKLPRGKGEEDRNDDKITGIIRIEASFLEVSLS